MRQDSFRQRTKDPALATTSMTAGLHSAPAPRPATWAARHYRLLFEYAPDGYLATDVSGTIREANRAAAILVRAPPGGLVGRTLASFVCDEERRAFRAELHRLKRTRPRGTKEWVVRLRPAGAEPFEAALTVSFLAERLGDGTGLLWSLRDVTRRRRVEEKLKQSERRYRSLYAEVLRHRDALRILSTRSLYAREEEAKRIAHELHDEAGQITAAIHLALAEIEPELLPSGRERLRRIGVLIEGVEERLRQLSHELRPTILDDLGLIPALAFLANGFSARTQVAVAVKGSTGGRLDPLIETALYRIVQEALANVGKHARAARAEITLAREDGKLVCAIRDDGVGFSDRPARRGVGRPAGLGLLGIRERLGALNGQMQILSTPGEGTELRVSVPLRQR
jgi:PAS domain S-box-containing protein